jgi:MFS family permease
VALASGFGQDLITPVLPAYLTLLGIHRASIGLIDGILQGTTSIFRFVSGILSDRFKNRKTPVFIGYALSSIARPLLAFAGTFGTILTLRGADGIGKGTKDAPRDALVADSAHAGERGRAFGFHRLIDTAGSVLGPLAAAALLFALGASIHSYRTIFALAAIPGAVALGLIFFGIREPRRVVVTQLKSHSTLNAVFWIFTIGTAIAMLTKVNDSLVLVRSITLGVPTIWVPVLFAGFTLVYALLSYPIGIWSDKIGRLPLIAGGWLVLALTELGLSFTPSLPLTLGLFVLYGLFFALTEGSGRALIADLVAPESRGTAYGIFNTVTGIAVIAGGFGIGRVWDIASPHAAFTISAIGSLVAAMIFASLARTRFKTVTSG